MNWDKRNNDIFSEYTNPVFPIHQGRLDQRADAQHHCRLHEGIYAITDDERRRQEIWDKTVKTLFPKY